LIGKTEGHTPFFDNLHDLGIGKFSHRVRVGKFRRRGGQGIGIEAIPISAYPVAKDAIIVIQGPPLFFGKSELALFLGKQKFGFFPLGLRNLRGGFLTFSRRAQNQKGSGDERSYEK